MPALTYYMSRVVNVPPRVACAAFDDLCDEAAMWHIATDHGVLVMGAALLPTTSTARVAPARLTRGVTRMRVTFEIEPWSSRRTQIGLRPERWGRRAWPSDHQLDVGHRALEVLGAEIECWADEPFRTLVASWPTSQVSKVTD